MVWTAGEFGVDHSPGSSVACWSAHKCFRTIPTAAYQLAQQLEQTGILLGDVGVVPKQVIVDRGCRCGVDRDNPGVKIIHRGNYKSPSKQDRRWLRRRQAMGLEIGHLKTDHRLNHRWLASQAGDAVHAVLHAVGYNLRLLLWAIIERGINPLFMRRCA